MSLLGKRRHVQQQHRMLGKGRLVQKYRIGVKKYSLLVHGIRNSSEMKEAEQVCVRADITRSASYELLSS